LRRFTDVHEAVAGSGRRVRSGWAVGLLLVLLITVGTAEAQNLPAQAHLTTLSGTVFKDDGTLADSGRVTIETSDGRVPRAAAVDASGHFIFTRLQSGTYNARAYYKGEWSEWQRNVIVRHGKVTEITLRVAPGAVEKPKK
jgi:Carboxypeptidase regulatory-like domain